MNDEFLIMYCEYISQISIKSVVVFSVEKPLSKEERKRLQDIAKQVPVDDVWIQKYYPEPKYTIEQAIEMHKEALGPEMLNCADSLVKLRADLDLSTKKKVIYLA